MGKTLKHILGFIPALNIFIFCGYAFGASVFYGQLHEAPVDIPKENIKAYRLDINPAEIQDIDDFFYLEDDGYHMWNVHTDNAFGTGQPPNGTEVMVFVSYETNSGTSDHKGFYATSNRNYDNTSGLNEFPVMTLMSIPIPAGIINGADVELTWTDIAQTDTNVIGYNIYRSLTPQSGFTKINSSMISTNAYTDTNVDFSGGNQYYYTLGLIFRGDVISTYFSGNSAVLSDCEAIIAVKDQEILQLSETINNLNTTIASMLTQAQSDEAVAAAVEAERAKWDMGNDNKKGLEEAIDALQVVAGVK